MCHCDVGPATPQTHTHLYCPIFHGFENRDSGVRLAAVKKSLSLSLSRILSSRRCSTELFSTFVARSHKLICGKHVASLNCERVALWWVTQSDRESRSVCVFFLLLPQRAASARFIFIRRINIHQELKPLNGTTLLFGERCPRCCCCWCGTKQRT